MDLNYTLLWIVGITAALMLGRALRQRTRETRHWLLLSLVALGLLGAGLLFFPAHAGEVAGVFWLLFVILPGVVGNAIQRRILRQEYGRARRAFHWLRWLQPFADWREQDDILRALELAQRGDLADARALLERYRDSNSPLARSAAVLCLRLENRWEELVAWCQAAGVDEARVHDFNILSAYLRALGETGRLNEMVATIDRHAGYFAGAHMQLLSEMCLQMLFAFCGRRAAAEGLLQGRLRAYAPDVKSFWLATASLAAGDAQAARAVFEALRRAPDFMISRAAEHRLQTPLAGPSAVLTAESCRVLDRLERERQVERQYGEFSGAHGFTPYATHALIAVNVAFFLAELVAGGSEKLDVLFRLGALYVPSVLAGDWWRIPASTVLHFGYLHLLMNMLGLYLLGPYLELRLGRVRYLLGYLFIGCGAAGMSVLLAYLRLLPDEVFCVGASGGILGLVGGSAAVLLRGWRQHRTPALRRRLGMIGLVIALQMVFDVLTPEISNTTHIAGLLLGFLLVWFLPLRLPAAEAIRE